MALTKSELRELEILRELEARESVNLLRSYFPDKGPLRRELYTKHLDFIRATAQYREVCFMAGNRCITPWTYLSNNLPALSAFCAEEFDVHSWDGDSQCNARASGAFLKGILPAFRVVMEDNQFFDCTDEHRLLTSEGYLSLRQLMSSSNGLRWKQKREDYQANCVEDGYLCDQPLLAAKDIFSSLIPSQDDVQGQSRIVWNKDEVERIRQYNHDLQDGDLLTNLDDCQRALGLFLMFSAPIVCTNVLQLKQNTFSFLQSLPELFLNLQQDGEAHHLGKYELYRVSSVEPSSLVDEDYCSVYFPLDHISLVGGKRIIALVPLGFQPIVDFTVPKYKNYKAAGVFHHNTGKSETVAYCAAVWLTGLYPHWWDGKRFNKPVNILVAGETARLVRDSIQTKLLGPHSARGTGLIPKANIINCSAKSGVPDAVDTVEVRHVSGGVSLLQFQSYDQGREAFQATARDVVIEDEEPPISIHNECLIRTMTTRGIVLLAFTPLKGMSETVMSFSKKDEQGVSKIIRAGWDDAPHLSEEDKNSLMAALPPYQRDARSKGIPQLGSGAVYPVPETDLIVDPFEVPAHFRRAYGMDVGWNNTAAVWGAHDADADILYITSDYKRGQCEPSSHADAIRARRVIKGVVDPASRGRGQDDGKKLIDQYRDLGLDLTIADNAVESGIFELYTRMTTGRLKIFKTCQHVIEELRLYRRDDKGRIVKDFDHCMDALRYLSRSGLGIATAGLSGSDTTTQTVDPFKRHARGSWMSC